MNKTALITGGSGGIGRAIANHLSSEGWKVAIMDVREPDEELETGLLFLTGDVSSEEDVHNAITRTVFEFGGLDGLVNNAGIGHGSPLESLALSDWNRVIGTNLTGTFLCTKHAAKHLRESGGSIVNIASTRAHQSEKNTEAYSASKGGIVALTHAAAVSLGPEIRVNCISPGWIDNRKDAVAQQSKADKSQHPCGRVGTSSDIAEMVSYLLSEKASFITGQEFIVDGGMTRKMIYVE